MHPSARALLDAHRGEIDAACRRFGVRRLRIFGSALGDDWSPERSDLDFAAEYGPERESLPPLDAAVGLQLALERALKVDIDVVDWASARNPYFRQAVEARNQDVYVA